MGTTCEEAEVAAQTVQNGAHGVAQCIHLDAG